MPLIILWNLLFELTFADYTFKYFFKNLQIYYVCLLKSFLSLMICNIGKVKRNLNNIDYVRMLVLFYQYFRIFAIFFRMV